MDLFEKRLRKKYPDATKEELESLKKKESYLRLETREECLAKLKTTLYILSLIHISEPTRPY